MKLPYDFLIGLLGCYVFNVAIWKPHLGHLLPLCFLEIFTNFSCEKPALQLIDFTRKTGSGEGIRTLDPDLGKIHAGSIKIYSLNVHAVHTTPYNLLIYFNCRSQPSLDWFGENLCSPQEIESNRTHCPTDRLLWLMHTNSFSTPNTTAHDLYESSEFKYQFKLVPWRLPHANL